VTTLFHYLSNFTEIGSIFGLRAFKRVFSKQRENLISNIRKSCHNPPPPQAPLGGLGGGGAKNLNILSESIGDPVRYPPAAASLRGQATHTAFTDTIPPRKLAQGLLTHI